MQLNTVKSKIIFFITTISLFIAVRYFFDAKRDMAAYYLNIEYEGRVNKKLLDPNARYQPTVLIEGNNNSYLLENIDIYNLIQPGNYIIKKKGTTKHTLIKQNDTTFFFPQIDGKDLRADK